jgi:hypothetical protein
MLGAIAVGGLGYAEGGRLAKEMGGWQVICWALVLSTPLLIGPVVYLALQHQGAISAKTWWAFGYVSLFSQFSGSLPGTPGWPWAGLRGSVRSSCCRSSSPSRFRRCSLANTSSRSPGCLPAG